MIDINVLVAEDEPGLRKLVTRFLTNVEAEPIAVPGGDLAFQEYLLRPHGYDLILTDVQMPQGDGMSLIRGILGRNPQQDNIYAMSGDLGRYEVEEFIELLGAGHLIQKPFSPEVIYSIVNKVGTQKLRECAPASNGLQYLENEVSLMARGIMGEDRLYRIDLGELVLHYKENTPTKSWILTDQPSSRPVAVAQE